MTRRRWLDPRDAWDDPTGHFLLCCLRGRFDARALEQAQALHASGQVDWAALLQRGPQRVLLPLLYDVLREQPWPPPEALSELKAAYRAHAVRNTLLLRELEHIVDLLGGSGMGAIVLKGGALAEAVYGNAALRPMTDLDLLIRREELPAILDLLTQEGYRVDTALDAHEGMGAAFENQMILRKQSPAKVMLELHSSLLDSPYYQDRLPMDWFWGTALLPHPLPPLLQGKGVHVLGPEAQLLHLCAHLALHHAGEGLLWLHDIAEVVHRYRDQLDWELLLAKAVEYDLVLPVQQILPDVVEGWGAPVPPWALERLRALEPSAEEVRVYNWLSVGRRPVVQRFWADLSSMPGWGARIRYGLGSLFPSGAYMVRRYSIPHPLLTPFYYPYRWLVGLSSAMPRSEQSREAQRTP